MTAGAGIYFQISGPDVHIEFADQQGPAVADVDGVNTSGWGHIHTIYATRRTTTRQRHAAGSDRHGRPPGRHGHLSDSRGRSWLGSIG
jgi:hypothetical protein